MSLYLYIIPIYNTVSYLNQYIESIINQSYENLEFLLNLKISQANDFMKYADDIAK